jgi:glycosyltransferase involved in cell wall biosynthesis
MTNNHRVLIFIKGLDIGGSSGGAELFGANLACGLYEQGMDVTLCVCFKSHNDTDSELTTTLQEKGIELVFLMERLEKPALNTYLKVLDGLNRYLKNHPKDIIHSHFQAGTLIAILLKVLGKVRWVVRTAHIDEEWKRGWNGLIRQSIIRLLLFVIFPIFVDSEAAVSRSSVLSLDHRFVAKFLSKKASLIHNAIPISGDVELIIKRKNYAGWQGDHPVIGSVGRLEEQKGYGYFITAIPEVVQQYPNLEVWLIGGGECLEKLKELSRQLGIEDRVIFRGKQNKVSDFLSGMDIFISSSDYEGLPTVVLEAMMNGIPCIVTDIPGTSDIVEEKNVVLVPARDYQALSRAIIQVLNTPSLREILAINAMETVKKFSIENISREYARLYRTL